MVKTLKTRTVPSRNYHTPRTLTLPLGTDCLKWEVLTEYFITWKVVEKHIKEPCDDVWTGYGEACITWIYVFMRLAITADLARISLVFWKYCYFHQ